MRRVLLLVVFVTFGCFGAVKTDTLKAVGNTIVVKDSTKFLKHVQGTTIALDSASIPVLKGAKTIRDTTTFTGGAYFAGIARFAGTLYASLATVDTFTNKVLVKNTTGEGTYGAIIKEAGSLPGYPTKYYPTLTTDYYRWYFVTKNQTRSYYSGFIGYDLGGTAIGLMDSSGTGSAIYLSTSGPSYINGSFKAAACTTTTVNTDSIKINGGSYLNAYLDTTFYDSLYDGSDYRGRTLCRIVQIGKCVTLYQEELQGTITASTLTLIKGIPSKFTPSATIQNACSILNNSVGEIGIFMFSVSSYKITNSATSTLDAGTGGINHCVLQWVID